MSTSSRLAEIAGGCRRGVCEVALPCGEHRDGLKEVGALDRGQDRVGGPLSWGLLPIVVQPEVFAGLLVVTLVASESSGEQLEDVEGQAAGVDLLEDRGDGGLLVSFSSTIAGMS